MGKGLLTWLREGLSITADVLQVIGSFTVLVSGAYAAYVFVVSQMTGVALFWVLVFAPLAGFFFLLFLATAIRMRRPENRSFDINAWRDHSVYTVWVAACLWTDLKPWPHIPADSEAYPALQMIKAAIKAGEISVVEGNGNMNSRVARQELVRLADAKGVRPSFLN